MVDLIICPGIEKMYAVAVTTPVGGFERVSEHDTPTAALNARDDAKAAAADALIALAELSPVLKQKAA